MHRGGLLVSELSAINKATESFIRQVVVSGRIDCRFILSR